MRRGVSGAGAALVCLRAAVWGALTCAFSRTSPIASKDWASAMSLPSRSIPRSTLTANGPSPGGGSSASPPSSSIANAAELAVVSSSVASASTVWQRRSARSSCAASTPRARAVLSGPSSGFFFAFGRCASTSATAACSAICARRRCSA